MRRLFDKQHAGLECLWGRGILPASLVQEVPRLRMEDIEPVATPGFSELVEQQKEAFTDGSGGPRWVPQASKRAGSAAATIRAHTVGDKLRIDNVGILVAPAPGKP